MKTAQILNRKVLGVPFTQNHKTEMVNLTQFIQELTSIKSKSPCQGDLEPTENIEDSNSSESDELEHVENIGNFQCDSEKQIESTSSKSVSQTDLEVIDFTKEISDTQNYFRNTKTIALMNIIAEEEGLNKDQIKTSKRGKYGGTWVHPLIFVDFLMWISPEFHYAGLKLIYDNVIKYRDAGGNSFRKVNAALLDNGYIKSGFEYSQLAKEVGQRCNAPTLVEDKPNGKQKIKYDWNSASQDILEKRDELQTKLVGLINLKIMPDVRAIIESIDKL